MKSYYGSQFDFESVSEKVFVHKNKNRKVFCSQKPS